MKRKYIYSDDSNSNRCDKSVCEFVFNINSLSSWDIDKSYNSINTSKLEAFTFTKLESSNPISVQVSKVTIQLQLELDNNLTIACYNLDINSLSAIESNTNISYESELQRKIAGVFSPEKAYLILSNSSFTFSVDNFNINFTKHIPDKDVITRAVKAVYGNV